MKILAFNGSPRKKWNTATLLSRALEGAASQGAETQLIHLYDLNFKGCISCFSCKMRGGKSYGKCAVKDDLTPILAQVEEADAIILGSPVYLGTVSGEMHSFMERLMYPYLAYTEPYQSLFPKRINTGFIYTMNVPEGKKELFGQHFIYNEMFVGLIFGSVESLYSCDTYQFKDYSKVVADQFDPIQKAQRRKDVFPKDCEKAFELGMRLVKE